MTVEPAATAVQDSAGNCALCTSLARRAASARAARTSGSSSASAADSAAGGTTVLPRSTPSNLAVYSRTASAPRSMMSSQMGRTWSETALTSAQPGQQGRQLCPGHAAGRLAAKIRPD